MIERKSIKQIIIYNFFKYTAVIKVRYLEFLYKKVNFKKSEREYFITKRFILFNLFNINHEESFGFVFADACRRAVLSVAFLFLNEFLFSSC